LLLDSSAKSIAVCMYLAPTSASTVSMNKQKKPRLPFWRADPFFFSFVIYRMRPTEIMVMYTLPTRFRSAVRTSAAHCKLPFTREQSSVERHAQPFFIAHTSDLLWLLVNVQAIVVDVTLLILTATPIQRAYLSWLTALPL